MHACCALGTEDIEPYNPITANMQKDGSILFVGFHYFVIMNSKQGTGFSILGYQYMTQFQDTIF